MAYSSLPCSFVYEFFNMKSPREFVVFMSIVLIIIYIAKNLQDALSKMNQIMTTDSVILLENDLPDNYL